MGPRIALILVGAALMGAFVSAMVHLVLIGRAGSSSFVVDGVLAGLGLGLILSGFVPSDARTGQRDSH